MHSPSCTPMGEAVTNVERLPHGPEQHVSDQPAALQSHDLDAHRDQKNRTILTSISRLEAFWLLGR